MPATITIEIQNADEKMTDGIKNMLERNLEQAGVSNFKIEIKFNKEV